MTRQNRRIVMVGLLGAGIASALILAVTLPEAEGADGGVRFRLNGPDGEPVPMNITLENLATGDEYTFASGTGHGLGDRLIPAGKYRAYIRAFWQWVPYVVDVQDVEVPAGDIAEVQSAFAEGAGRVALPGFDRDFDGVLDRVEYDVGTDPLDATDIPGAARVDIDHIVLNKEEGWYRGEFHTYSTYSDGKMPVRDIILRAEKMGLDFVAITDRASLESCQDENYKSDKVLLIPAYEWGVDGRATLLGARTLIKNWDNNPQVQAAIRQAHAQGVLFCVTDPCSAESPWEWTVSGFHAVEVWSREWRLERGTSREVLRRGERTRMIFPSEEIRSSLAGDNVCKNGQALKFWDSVLAQGHRVTGVGGSKALDRLADIGTPVTYVYAQELSVLGIIEGVLLGRTFVSSNLDGPKVLFMADVDRDGIFNARVDALVPGAVVPLRRARESEQYHMREGEAWDGEKVIQTEIAGPAENLIKFRVAVEGLGRSGNIKISVVKNGEVLRTGVIDPGKPVYDFVDAPYKPSYYRVEVFKTVTDNRFEQGYGNIEMLALTSPIYADFIPVPEEIVSEEKEGTEQEQKLEQ